MGPSHEDARLYVEDSQENPVARREQVFDTSQTDDGRLGRPVPVIPAEFRNLLGPPNILPGEDAGVYEARLVQIAVAIGPKDFIEFMWVKDLTDTACDVQRYRQMKEGLLKELQQDSLVRSLAKALHHYGRSPKLIPNEARTLAFDFAAGRPSARRSVTAFLRRVGEDLSSVAARSLNVCEDALKRVEEHDRLIAAAMARRDGIYREIDRRRSELAQRTATVRRDFADLDFDGFTKGRSGRYA